MTYDPTPKPERTSGVSPIIRRFTKTVALCGIESMASDPTNACELALTADDV